MVKIRLMRRGATKRPFYRVVVADSRSPRDGRFIENIGKYHPLEDPSLIEIDADRALHWLTSGAQPTEQVVNLLRTQGIWERFEAARTKRAPKPGRSARAAKPPRPAKSRPSPAAAEARSPAPAEDAGQAQPEETPKPKRRRRTAKSDSSS
jgi:small subunit ribosomal protein S16